MHERKLSICCPSGGQKTPKAMLIQRPQFVRAIYAMGFFSQNHYRVNAKRRFSSFLDHFTSDSNEDKCNREAKWQTEIILPLLLIWFCLLLDRLHGREPSCALMNEPADSASIR
jgi:hypothetical protein